MEIYSHGEEFTAAWYFASQSEYVTDGINLEVRLPNYIISFENLESDFNCMVSLLDISVELRHMNPTILDEGNVSSCAFHLGYSFFEIFFYNDQISCSRVENTDRFKSKFKI